MCGLLLGLMPPHEGFQISWTGYSYNLGLVTLGNIVGGALFVASMYWFGSPKAREQAVPAAVPLAEQEHALHVTGNGVAVSG